MLVLLGLFIVSASILGGYLMEDGNLAVLAQPAGILIIVGAAIGSFIIASPRRVVKLVLSRVLTIFKGRSASKQAYLQLLALLNHVLLKIRKDGLIAIEGDIEDPEKSAVFAKYKAVFETPSAVEFICDNLKVIITANMPPHELDSLMELDIDARHQEEMTPAHSIATVADALPGLGIVAAVLGVVRTMNKIDSPPDVLGRSIGAALLGTFLGVMLCYGFVGPVAKNLEYKAKEKEVKEIPPSTGLGAK